MPMIPPAPPTDRFAMRPISTKNPMKNTGGRRSKMMALMLIPPELELVAATSTLCAESRAASRSCGGTVGICDE